MEWGARNDADCCIQSEVGNFNTWGERHDHFHAEGKTEEEVGKNMLNLIISTTQEKSECYDTYDYDGVQIKFFWFKDPRNYKGGHGGKYQFDGLRQAVMKHEWAKHIGTYINANTGNKMDGWMLVIPCEKQEREDEDEDEDNEW